MINHETVIHDISTDMRNRQTTEEPCKGIPRNSKSQGRLEGQEEIGRFQKTIDLWPWWKRIMCDNEHMRDQCFLRSSEAGQVSTQAIASIKC